MFNCVCFQYFQVLINFLFSGCSDFFSWFSNSISSVICLFPPFIISIAHLSLPKSSSVSSLHILTACIKVSNSFLSSTSSVSYHCYNYNNYYHYQYYYFIPIKAFHNSVSKSPKVSRTLLSILAYLNYAVVWIVSNCPLIFKSSSPFINPLFQMH